MALTIRLGTVNRAVMRKLALTFAIVLICGAFAYAGPEALPSSGKEMKQTVAPAPECDFSWTGFYVGIRGGYGWSNNDDVHIRVFFPNQDLIVDPPHQNLDSDGFVGGGEFGFNWQFGKWFVLGAEADFSGSDISGNSTRVHDFPQFSTDMADVRISQRVDWFGTVRGRVGFVPWCRMLIYGTGGFAYASVDDSAVIDFVPFGGVSHFPASHDDTETGWTAGGGIEFAISHHWSVKVEYLYMDVGDVTAIAPQVPNLNNPPVMASYHFDNQFHTVAAGLNFKF